MPHRPFSGLRRRGIFAKHRLEGELLYVDSGTMNIAALLGGSVQIAGGGPVSIEARLRGIKLTILRNPLPSLASNLVVHPDVEESRIFPVNLPVCWLRFIPPIRIFAIVFRKNVSTWTGALQENLCGISNSSRVAALKTGTIQYTFLGAAATDNARALGFRVLATARRIGDTFPLDFRGRRRTWLNKNRELAYRYMKCSTEAIVTLKRNRADSERIISKYMKINDAKLAATEFDFVASLMPDYITPTLEGAQLISRLRQRMPDART